MTTVAWYYCNDDNQEVGPISPQALMQAVKDGLIVPHTPIRQMDGDWMPAHQVKALFPQGQTQPPLSQSVSTAAPSSAASVRTTASTETHTETNLSVIDQAEARHFKVEVLAYDRLIPQNSLTQAANIHYANQVGIKLKQIRITLTEGEAIAEAGALHYLHGNIVIENKSGGAGGLGKAVLKSLVTNETIFRPRYRGTGCIYLEPSFGHYLIYPLNGEEMIVDKGLYACSEGSIEVGVAVQKNFSAGVAGGEGWFQTKVSGRGICVFVLPVPLENIRCVELRNETLQVDGSFALMRTGNINFTVERSTKGLLGTVTSGEGLLQTFRGTGKVWLAPTLGYY